MMRGWIGLLLIFSALTCSTSSAVIDDVAVNVERSIDISTQVVKVIVKYELINGGAKPLDNFIHLVSKAEDTKLAYITCVEAKKDSKLHVQKVDPRTSGIKTNEFVAYQVNLPSPVAPGSKTAVVVEYQVTQYLEPFPKQISQAEVQFVLYKGNAHVPCFYAVSSETTVVILPNGKLESYTTVSPTKVDGTKIIYGPYTDQKPFSLEEIVIHSENNSPFVVATDISRLIEVSHWGNIAVEEMINIVHKGAELRGPFSRLDFQMDRRGNRRPVVTYYKTLLPASAKDIYYRDEIGNISTSSVRKMLDAVELTITPRFPLFGGWRTDYIVGYNVPAYQYLNASGNSFALKMRLIDHIFDDAVIEHVKLKIILPEGSKNFKLTTPYSVKRLPNEILKTYLDTYGRPVIVIEKDNLVNAHIEQFTLHYEFDRFQLWREPLLACAAYAVLFLIVIIYVRLDFTISPDAAIENRLQVQGFIEKMTDLHADRLKIYDQYIDSARKFSANKDAVAYGSSRKKIDNDLKNVIQSVADVQSEIKIANGDVTDKLNEINKIHKTAMDVINNYISQVERLCKGQLSKVSFAETEKTCNQKLNEVKEKMDAIIYAL